MGGHFAAEDEGGECHVGCRGATVDLISQVVVFSGGWVVDIDLDPSDRSTEEGGVES